MYIYIPICKCRINRKSKQWPGTEFILDLRLGRPARACGEIICTPRKHYLSLGNYIYIIYSCKWSHYRKHSINISDLPYQVILYVVGFGHHHADQYAKHNFCFWKFQD